MIDDNALSNLLDFEFPESESRIQLLFKLMVLTEHGLALEAVGGYEENLDFVNNAREQVSDEVRLALDETVDFLRKMMPREGLGHTRLGRRYSFSKEVMAQALTELRKFEEEAQEDSADQEN